MAVNICCSAHLAQERLNYKSGSSSRELPSLGYFCWFHWEKVWLVTASAMVSHYVNLFPGDAGPQEVVGNDFSLNFIRIDSRQVKSNNILSPGVSEVKVFKIPTLMYLLEQFYIAGLSCSIPCAMCLCKRKSLEKE